jgi:hypothetical protein
MKSINTNFKTWESIASASLENGERFELMGFDMDVQEHRAFWNKVKRTGKFHASFEPHVKATFIPAT